jgi:hypothetical protein
VSGGVSCAAQVPSRTMSARGSFFNMGDTP